MSVTSRIAAAAAAVDYAGLLTDTCTIRRYTASTQGSLGTTGKVWSDLDTSVACRYDEPPIWMAGREILLGTDMVTITATIFFAVGQDITQKDRISSVDRSGTTILTGPSDVILVLIPSGELHHIEAYLGTTRTA